ncbi:MAG: hypothetical protein J4451_01935 [DPANN group archaeon]|nr:hypothetical protein [DPANN group archaeon]
MADNNFIGLEEAGIIDKCFDKAKTIVVYDDLITDEVLSDIQTQLELRLKLRENLNRLKERGIIDDYHYDQTLLEFSGISSITYISDYVTKHINNSINPIGEN